MQTQTKAAVKTVKSAARRREARVKPSLNRAVSKAKSSAKPVGKKGPAQARARKKKNATGFIQSVKDGVHSAMETAGDLVKRVTPDALLPDSAKAKRR
jgi:hypothetical protein